jgi:predicted metal-dependent peptidase
MDLLKLKTWGIPPTMWTAPKVGRKRGEVSVAIYLDLSGSVTEYLPRICRIISSMKKEIQLIFGFSNIVEDHTLNQLRRGEIKTTGGTDFNCIARHLLENKYKKCVIITDGYAYIDSEYKRKIKAQLASCACILFGKMDNKENWFSQNFDSFYLDEVVV